MSISLQKIQGVNHLVLERSNMFIINLRTQETCTSYTVDELEVTFSKRLEMIEKLDKFYKTTRIEYEKRS